MPLLRLEIGLVPRLWWDSTVSLGFGGVSNRLPEHLPELHVAETNFRWCLLLGGGGSNFVGTCLSKRCRHARPSVQQHQTRTADGKITIFRRKRGLRDAAAGGARSKGKTRRGVWSLPACALRYCFSTRTVLLLLLDGGRWDFHRPNPALIYPNTAVQGVQNCTNIDRGSLIGFSTPRSPYRPHNFFSYHN